MKKNHNSPVISSSPKADKCVKHIQIVILLFISIFSRILTFIRADLHVVVILPEGSSGIAVVLLVLSVHVFFQLFRSSLVVSDYDIERDVFSDYRGFQKLERNCKALRSYMKRHDRSLYLVILLKQIKSSVYEERKNKC